MACRAAVLVPAPPSAPYVGGYLGNISTVQHRYCGTRVGVSGSRGRYWADCEQLLCPSASLPSVAQCDHQPGMNNTHTPPDHHHGDITRFIHLPAGGAASRTCQVNYKRISVYKLKITDNRWAVYFILQQIWPWSFIYCGNNVLLPDPSNNLSYRACSSKFIQLLINPILLQIRTIMSHYESKKKHIITEREDGNLAGPLYHSSNTVAVLKPAVFSWQERAFGIKCFEVISDVADPAQCQTTTEAMTSFKNA